MVLEVVFDSFDFDILISLRTSLALMPGHLTQVAGRVSLRTQLARQRLIEPRSNRGDILAIPTISLRNLILPTALDPLGKAPCTLQASRTPSCPHPPIDTSQSRRDHKPPNCRGSWTLHTGAPPWAPALSKHKGNHHFGTSSLFPQGPRASPPSQLTSYRA